ncbi:MAG: hypothetical protein LVS60_16620 [Nodosilinea sp. LVE1205-7]|jgi:hypothetical protein
MAKIRPKRFQFDAFDAGVSDTPARSKNDNVEIETDSTKSTEKPKIKTLQQYLDDLAEDI